MNAKRATLLVLAVLLAALAALLVRPYLQFALLAVLLAYLLHPFQRRLEPRVGPRTSAGLLVVVAVVAVLLPLAYLVAVVVTQAGTVVEALRASRDALATVEEAAATYLGVELDAAMAGSENGGPLVDTVLGVFGGLTEFGVGVVVTLFLLYYLLKDGDDLVSWACSVVPLPDGVQDDVLDELDDLAWAVLVGNVAVAVVQGVLTGVGLFVAGFSNVVFWTVVTVILALLPIVGAPLVWGPAAAILALEGRTAAAVLLVAYGAVLVNVADDYLRPVIGGHEAQLNPGLFVVGIFGGLALFGVMGVFFGPIVLGVAKLLLEAVGREFGDGDATPGEPPPPPV